MMIDDDAFNNYPDIIIKWEHCLITFQKDKTNYQLGRYHPYVSSDVRLANGERAKALAWTLTNQNNPY